MILYTYVLFYAIVVFIMYMFMIKVSNDFNKDVYILTVRYPSKDGL